MRRSKLIGTTMALSLAIVMSGAITGCGNKEEQSNVEAVAVVEETAPVETITAEESTSTVETAVDEETTETATESETTGIEETTVPSTDVAFEPYIMYTNSVCNIRSEASADSEILGSYPVNTSVEVIGIEENEWSKFVYDGCEAYVKSSLLSDTKVEVKSASTNDMDSTTQSQTTSQQSASSQNFPADVASSKYLSRFLNKGYDHDTIIFLVREAETQGMVEDSPQDGKLSEATPEERAQIAGLSEGVVVE